MTLQVSCVYIYMCVICLFQSWQLPVDLQVSLDILSTQLDSRWDAACGQFVEEDLPPEA